MKNILLLFCLITIGCRFSQAQNLSSEKYETSIKKYFDSNNTEPIEGIYKVIEGTYYRIAIKKSGEKFIATVIEAENKDDWKAGNLKATIEKSSLPNIFSIRWLIGDKTPIETIGKLENEALFKLTLPSGLYGSEEDMILLKMYPLVNSQVDKKRSGKIVSGSGFFVSTNGVIATNEHVIENAKTIEIFLSNDIGNFSYNAKLLIKDQINDVALIQIDDKNFEGLTVLPYGISDKAEIGENSFTIGYPLNDVMGSNYKLTNGIISAISGIEDDVRYYQISIPLQPGNSGGPLFNNQGNVIGITTAKLNSEAVGTSVENVNYAIKSTYLISIINMIPNISIPQPKYSLSGEELKDQVKVLKNYVCLIQVTE